MHVCLKDAAGSGERFQVSCLTGLSETIKTEESSHVVGLETLVTTEFPSLSPTTEKLSSALDFYSISDTTSFSWYFC